MKACMDSADQDIEIKLNTSRKQLTNKRAKEQHRSGTNCDTISLRTGTDPRNEDNQVNNDDSEVMFLGLK